MSTTTSEDGAVQAQPTTDGAGNDEGAQVVTTDEHGTPTMAPLQESAVEETAEETTQTTESTSDEAPAVEEAQAGDSDEDVVEWAKKKGLEINPENPNELKLARLQLENDRRFHEAQQNKPKISPPTPIDETDNESVNAIIQRQNDNELRMYVRDWFDANPEMKEHRQELMRIANERPWLSDLDDVAAHYLASPERFQQAEQQGGRKALENLAQKQAAVPPRPNASNPQSLSSDNVITPQNVYDLVEKNDQQWFERNYDAINKAMQG